VSEDGIEYVGQELEIFARAVNWKRYWRAQLATFLRGDVLEVGAGIGTNTPLLMSAGLRSWTCLEPDPKLAHQLREHLAGMPTTVPWTVQVGTVADLPPDRRFDAMLYIDVLEHIADDRAEVEKAVNRLRVGGALIVLSPAHQFLFSPFDQAVGHFRRYTRGTLRALTPPGATLRRLRYLDAVGLLASGANAALLRQSVPGERQIMFWDRLLVPCSRALDPLLGYRVGKSVLGIWERSS
jgi:SAM-dependent methyltransferase